MNIEYPKRFMRITELVELGYGRDMLNRCIHIKGFPCQQLSGAKNSVFLIDTQALPKWLEDRKREKKT